MPWHLVRRAKSRYGSTSYLKRVVTCWRKREPFASGTKIHTSLGCCTMMPIGEVFREEVRIVEPNTLAPSK